MNDERLRAAIDAAKDSWPAEAAANTRDADGRDIAAHDREQYLEDAVHFHELLDRAAEAAAAGRREEAIEAAREASRLERDWGDDPAAAPVLAALGGKP